MQFKIGQEVSIFDKYKGKIEERYEDKKSYLVRITEPKNSIASSHTVELKEYILLLKKGDWVGFDNEFIELKDFNFYKDFNRSSNKDFNRSSNKDFKVILIPYYSGYTVTGKIILDMRVDTIKIITQGLTEQALLKKEYWKWKKIERKVNEYKEGDVVSLNNQPYLIDKVEKNKVHLKNSCHMKVIVNINEIKLICPVNNYFSE